MIGLYPLTGQTTFLIGSPWLKDLTINLGGGAKLEITAQGASSEDAIYVQSLKVNGKDWDKAWVSWNDVFRDGGKMEFVLGKNPVNWATGPPPPSPAVGDSLDVPEPPESPERRRSLTTRDYIAGGVIIAALGGSAGFIITLGYRHVSKRKDKKVKSGYRRARVSDSGEEPENDGPFEEPDSDLERASDRRSRSRRSALRS
jgi:hypothetical protein